MFYMLVAFNRVYFKFYYCYSGIVVKCFAFYNVAPKGAIVDQWTFI